MCFCSHKRSKSYLALSILHRERSRADDKLDDASATSSPVSASGSPTSSQLGFNPLKPQRSRPQTSEPGVVESTTAAASDAPGRESTNTVKQGMSIEQSVRMFRYFEVLRSGDIAAITKAVQETSSTSGTRGKAQHPLEGTTILHLAIQCAEPQVVDQILSVATTDPHLEIDINAQDKAGNTPLHLASMLGRASIVRALLMQSDIDAAILNYQGRSPLDLARNPEIFQHLQLSRSVFIESKVKAIQQLLNKVDYDGLEKLLEEPRVETVLDVNWVELVVDPATLETGGTLLHEAARKRDLRLIQILLLHGADPFRRDRKGKLPQDVTKDEKTRSILKRSPAAAAAQRGIQEKAILGNSQVENPIGSKESREIKGYLKKWTNYTTGYKLRWFVLEDSVLSYYKHQGRAI